MADFAGRSGHIYLFVKGLLSTTAFELQCIDRLLEGHTLYSIRKVHYIFRLKILTKCSNTLLCINRVLSPQCFFDSDAYIHFSCF